MLKPMDLFEVMGNKINETQALKMVEQAYDKGINRVLGEVAGVKLAELEQTGDIDTRSNMEVKKRYEQVERLKKKMTLKYGQEIAQDLWELDNAFTDLSVSECDVYFKRGFIEGYKFKKEAGGIA